MALSMVTVVDHLVGVRPRAVAQTAGPNSNMEKAYFHQPVLLQQAVENLVARSGGVYVDATVGEGGHTLGILQASAPVGRVLGIDLDPRSLTRASQRLIEYGDRLSLARGNYTHMVECARAEGITHADGVLLDLGLSSIHLEAEGYGFSFQKKDELLDMRYDPDAPLTAAHIVNTYREGDLSRLIFQFGEEPRALAIARAIVRSRPINSTRQLAQLVAASPGPRRRWRTHPATRTFQALRIAVNQELDNIPAGLQAAIRLLAPGGRLVVISYHSLEDRPVKATLARESAQCICPPGLPVCVCGHQPTVRIISRRVIRPTSTEVRSNPRSRSARMRVAERL